MEENRIFLAIDLKSFYASVECAERGRDPLTTNLVVADASRTKKTICLAVSPSLKAYGISGRARLFEAVSRVREVNRQRQRAIGDRPFNGESDDDVVLRSDPYKKLSFIIAPPRMNRYMDVSAKIYSIYLKHVAPEDIHSYSIDEVFIDATYYLKLYKITPHEFAMRLIRDVLSETQITATAGIGTNMYLAKVAMDIVAKHMPPDRDGVRIAELDEMTYRKTLWDHKPITDFWRVGKGYAARLSSMGLYTMGDVARCSVRDEERLYKQFGVNAELLIDHAWGWEPALISDIKSYKPESNSISSGQVLKEPYGFEKGRLIVMEMTDQLVLDLVEKGLATDQMVLTVGYDTENTEPQKKYSGTVVTDRYGRKIPKDAHGSINLGRYSSSAKLIVSKVMELYDRIVDRDLTVRRMYVVANRVIPEADAVKEPVVEQINMFTDVAAEETRREAEKNDLEREKRIQQATIKLKKKFGKNAVLKGMNLQEGATAVERNGQVGGHKA